MKKKYSKRLLAIVMVIIIVMGTTLTGFSNRNEDNISQHQKEIMERQNKGVTRLMCLDCAWYSHYVCQSNHRYDGNTTHSYWGGICRINWYNATAQEVCTSCGKALAQFGEHPSIENHLNCSKGMYKICMIGLPPGP